MEVYIDPNSVEVVVEMEPPEKVEKEVAMWILMFLHIYWLMAQFPRMGVQQKQMAVATLMVVAAAAEQSTLGNKFTKDTGPPQSAR